jgi:alpha-galactosidase
MLAPTPPMGWNSWNTFGGEIHEDLIRQTADAMVAEGLKDAGYQYLVIDDLWEAPKRDKRGQLVPDPEKFPSGMKKLANYVHGKGLKFGIYSCAGVLTCGSRPGSYGYEEQDARTFADWGVDYLKYDYCYKPPGAPSGPQLYHRMGQALRATGRPIVYSACEWGHNKPWEWAASAGCHLWRTTGDIEDSWESMEKIGFAQDGKQASAGPNHWNDPDMLVVGMYGKGHVAKGGMNDNEYRLHFSLWCMLAAPLMIGCDVRSMTPATKSILTNPRLIAINQDPLGAQGWRVGADWDSFETWKKPLADGSIAVALFNRHKEMTRSIAAPWEALALHDRTPCRVIDVWNDEDRGVHTRHYSCQVPPHSCCVLRLAPEV